MNINGIQKLTLLDFPGRVACTVFSAGCNMRCPFCHNAELVKGAPDVVMTTEEFFRFLSKRVGILDGVAMTGGEPLLQSDIIEFAKEIKKMGFEVKLDTNGTLPDRLSRIIAEGAVDYVAMDIKNSREKYAMTAGRQVDIEAVEQSVKLLLSGVVDYEFRTTVVKEFHDADDFTAIGEWINGARRYYLQQYRDSGATICEGLHEYGGAEMEAFADIVRAYVPDTFVRGVSEG